MSSDTSMHFFAPMENVPTATKQMRKLKAVRDKNSGKWSARSYPSDRWLAAEDAIGAAIERFRPSKPLEGPLELSVTWCFPKMGFADGTPKMTPPDTDNLDKGLKDIMTHFGWWEDDAQVAVEHIAKIHSRVTGIRIDIERLPQFPQGDISPENLVLDSDMGVD